MTTQIKAMGHNNEDAFRQWSARLRNCGFLDNESSVKADAGGAQNGAARILEIRTQTPRALIRTY